MVIRRATVKVEIDVTFNGDTLNLGDVSDDVRRYLDQIQERPPYRGHEADWWADDVRVNR